MGAGGDAGAEAKYLQRLHNAEGAAQALNNGAKAIAFWNYNTNYHKHWRMVTFDEKNPSHFVPDKTNYYPLALLMKYMKRGSDIVSTEVNGLRDENGVPRVFATTATLGKDVTILLVNDSESPATVKLKGVERKRRLHQHYVTNDSHDRINSGETMASGATTITLLPQSITVLTTYSYGSETVD
jgi:hypothetical protein